MPNPALSLIAQQPGTTGEAPLLAGVVATPAPTSLDGELWVLLPELSTERPVGPCKWAALRGTTLPAVGTPVRLMFDDAGVPVVVSWDGAYAETGVSGTQTNTAYGYHALASYTGSAEAGNTAFGYEAAATQVESATTAEIVEGSNTALGFQTLKVATATRNTAVGWRTLHDVTTGEENTAIGHYAAGVCTTGKANVAVGVYSMQSSTWGGWNTSVGAYSLNETHGSKNTALGYSAGYYVNEECTGNVCIGAESGPTKSTSKLVGLLYIGSNTPGQCLIEGNQGIDEAKEQALQLNTDKLGFFKTTPAARPSVAAAPTALEVAEALAKLGLITVA